MRGLQFGRPKGPGYAISSDFYITVLSARPTLPPLLQVINPHGEGGAVEGFGVPLGGETAPGRLAQPITRGAYALATRDRKTVLKMLVLSKEEASFNPEPYALSHAAEEAPAELVARVRATWLVLQLTFETHHADVRPSIRFLLLIARRIAELTEGSVADPVSERYLLPEDVVRPATVAGGLDVRDVVSVTWRLRPDGLHIFTLGMRKLALPEIEIIGCEQSSAELAAELLIGVCEGRLAGFGLDVGQLLGSAATPFEVRVGGLDLALWEGVPCLELVPPAVVTPGEALDAWERERKAAGR